MTKIATKYNRLINHQSGKEYDMNRLQTFCPEQKEPLVAQYELSRTLDKSLLSSRSHNMWRYIEMLPICESDNIVSLGEGYTPIVAADRLATKYEFGRLDLKNEAHNPTGSFKARGLSMAVSKAKELGATEFCIPTAGNAGSALSAYCAKAGLTAHVYMPEKTPQIFQLDCRIMGARVTLVDGNIADAGARMKRDKEGNNWFDVSTLKEPFRLEGKKTMGYEIAEQGNWQLPDVILYPTGGGTGLIGIWKAFKEMLELGWINNIPTKMVAVQTTGCDPIVSAFASGSKSSVPFTNPAETIANGLRVPHAFGHKLILQALYESQGTAIAVNERNMVDAITEYARGEGVFLSPEGAAVWHAARTLRASGWIKADDHVMMLNTGSGYKYAENIMDIV